MLKQIPQYDGYYADTDGIIYTTKRSGSTRQDFPMKPLKTWLRGKRPWHKGYLAVDLYKNGKKKRVNVHVLIMETFSPRPGSSEIIRHLNDISTDNRLDNLTWGSVADNRKDMWKNYRMFKEHYEKTTQACS